MPQRLQQHCAFLSNCSAIMSCFPQSREVILPSWFWSCCRRSTSSLSCQEASCIPPPPGKAPSHTTTSQLLWMLQATEAKETVTHVAFTWASSFHLSRQIARPDSAAHRLQIDGHHAGVFIAKYCMFWFLMLYYWLSIQCLQEGILLTSICCAEGHGGPSRDKHVFYSETMNVRENLQR